MTEKGDKPRFFSFTLRDLLWLMVVFAMGIVWWQESQRFERRYTDLKIQNEELRAENVLQGKLRNVRPVIPQNN
jgi:hypothetical protein